MSRDHAADDATSEADRPPDLLIVADFVERRERFVRRSVRRRVRRASRRRDRDRATPARPPALALAPWAPLASIPISARRPPPPAASAAADLIGPTAS